MFSEDTIKQIAIRTATILGEWINLNPVAKSDNGAPGLATALMAMLAQKSPAPPSDAVQKMADYIEDSIAKKLLEHHSVALWFDTDYSPGHELSNLAKSCEIQTSWPIKSHLHVSIYESGIYIKDSRGYNGVVHHFVDGLGWLVSPASIDQRILSIVLKAIERGEVEPSIARLEPFTKT